MHTFLVGLPKRFFLRAVDPSKRPIRDADSGVAAISENRCASYSSASCQRAVQPRRAMYQTQPR